MAKKWHVEEKNSSPFIFSTNPRLYNICNYTSKNKRYVISIRAMEIYNKVIRTDCQASTEKEKRKKPTKHRKDR